jgi:heme-degrading monooxygenase HmoA
MVRVILEHKAKDTEKLIEVIREARSEAMRQRGYITGETLINTEDISNVLVISTWEKIEDWKAWDKSEIRFKMRQRINELLVEPFTTKTYHYYLIKDKRVMSIL